MDIIRRTLDLWFRNNNVIIAVMISLSLALMFFIINVRNSYIYDLLSLSISIEILLSMKDPLERFFKILRYIGSDRKVFNQVIIISAALSMIPLYACLSIGAIDPWVIIVAFALLYYAGYIIRKRSIFST
ncbi:MAG: hypothetical protein ABWJ42_02505 [Sulfolobales archaeon]